MLGCFGLYLCLIIMISILLRIGFIGIVIAALIGVYFAVELSRAERRNKQDLQANHVEAQFGRVNKTVVKSRRSKTKHYIAIKDVSFPVSKIKYDVLNERDFYTFYYVPHSHMLLSIDLHVPV